MGVHAFRRASEAGRNQVALYAARVGTAAALALLSLPLISSSAGAESTLSFEVDGNRGVDSAGFDDWESVEGRSGEFTGYTSTPDGDAASGDTVYQAASESKDPLTWGQKPGTADTGGDITDVESYWTIDSQDHAWFYLGFSRAADGVASFAVELNQRHNQTTDAGVSVPLRSAGDIRLAFQQSTGGEPLTGITIDKWNGNSWTRTGQGAVDVLQSTSDDGRFAELGLDLTATGLQPDYSEGFTEVNLRGRASDRETSSLKDYVEPLDVNIPARYRAFTIDKRQFTEDGPSLSGAAFTVAPNPATGTGELRVVDGGANDPDGKANGVIRLQTTHYLTYQVVENEPPTTGDAAGWIIDTESHSADVATTKSGVVTFVNTLGSVTFTKTDAESGALVGGASFTLTKTSGAKQGTINVTDNGNNDADSDPGVIHVEGLKTGEWTATEVGPAPAGYSLPSEPSQTFEVTQATADVTLTDPFANPRKPASLVVEKRDTADGKLVDGSDTDGAEFRLYQDKGTVVGEYDGKDVSLGTKTTTDGVATWTDLPWGDYLVEEVRPPAGYEAKTERFQIVKLGVPETLEPGKVVFENDRTSAEIRVSKYDLDTKSKLGGATFQLFADDGDAVGQWDDKDTAIGDKVVADVDGNTYTWDSPKIVWGKTYLVKEMAYPAGFEGDPYAVNDAKPVTVERHDADGVGEAVFYDQKPGTGTASDSTITVTKTDAETGQLVDGARFELYLDGNENGGLDTDENGSVVAPDVLMANPAEPVAGAEGTYVWTGLPAGVYLVKEASPPPGYLPPEVGVQPVAVDGTNDKTVGFANDEKKSTIVLTKTDADTGAPVDATFALYKDGSSSAYNAPAHVANTGVYTWSDLPMGSYRVVELRQPAGYVAPGADAIREVTFTAGNAGRTIDVSMQNRQILSKIVVHKVDAETGQEIDGATFELTKGGDPVDVEMEHVRGTGTYTWSGLTMGTYKLTETEPPAGYLPPDQDSLDGDGTVLVEITANDVGVERSLTIENEQVPNVIIVHKYDEETRHLLDGATFTVFLDVNENGVVDQGDSSAGEQYRIGTGTYWWNDLPAGQYLVTEALPPHGYELAAQRVQAVDLDLGASKTVDFYNKPEDKGTGGGTTDPGTGGGGTTDPGTPDPGTANLVVTKRDATTKRLIDSAGFQLWQDANGNGRWDEGADEKVGGVESTEDGVVGWSDLEKATYFVQETKAPRGYDFPAVPVKTVVVDAGNVGTTLQATFDDPQKKTTIELVKRDDRTGEELAGATFQAYRDVDGTGTVTDADTRVGSPRVSNSDGMVIWSGLGFGRYLVEEVAAPEGYGLPAHPVQSLVIDRRNAGGVLRMVFLDPAQGMLRVTKKAFERDADGEWVPSDGTVHYGDRVRYVITTTATGPRVYRDVQVTDFVPGYAPEDTRSTAKAAYVVGSAGCGTHTCATSYDAIARELTWSLGSLRDATRRAEFVVRMPQLPMNPTTTDDGVYTDTVVNVAEASWTPRPSGTDSAARTSAAPVDATVRSNEVVTKVIGSAEILGLDPTSGTPQWHTPQDGGGLPNTGAPSHTGLVTTVGGLSLLLGAWLMLVGRKRGRLLLQRQP